VSRYWQLSDESQGTAGRFNSHLKHASAAITRHVVVRESYDEALAIARRSWPVFEQHWFATPILMDDDGQPAAQQPSAGGADFDDALVQDRRLLVGTPAMVRDKLASWLAALDGRPSLNFSPAVQWGDITTPEAIETARLLVRDVLPAFRA
jgi:alkanesulfonate monooxygenase SsuD/methylene tetrahydromethanopterin reductase-like flavin-dependent oxidoreductase (luciferase family)